jgi:hypothetical protein
MDLHGNAALSWSGRRELARRVVEQGWTLTAAAAAGGVSVRCARKRVVRYRAGDHDLFDRLRHQIAQALLRPVGRAGGGPQKPSFRRSAS